MFAHEGKAESTLPEGSTGEESSLILPSLFTCTQPTPTQAPDKLTRFPPHCRDSPGNIGPQRGSGIND